MGVIFSVCCAHACQALLLGSELTDYTLAKTKMEYISLPSVLNAIIGIIIV